MKFGGSDKMNLTLVWSTCKDSAVWMPTAYLGIV